MAEGSGLHSASSRSGLFGRGVGPVSKVLITTKAGSDFVAILAGFKSCGHCRVEAPVAPSLRWGPPTVGVISGAATRPEEPTGL